MKYAYFEHDNAAYRAQEGATHVLDVLGEDGWEPYEGKDRVAPAMFGTKITKEEAEALWEEWYG